MCYPKEGAIALYYIFSLYEMMKLHTFFYFFFLIVLEDDASSEVFIIVIVLKWISNIQE